jgi:predicted lactoylglutathione lyase
MKITAVHICFEVADFKKAMKFYAPLFKAVGFARGFGDWKTYGGFRNGAFSLTIGDIKPRRITRKAPTGNEFVVTEHVGFYTGRRRDVYAIEAAMAKAGFKPLFPAQAYTEFGPGFHAVTFCDRDNNVIEFSHRSRK